MKLRAAVHRLVLRTPLTIAGHSFESHDVLRLEVEHAKRTARAEAAGVFYLGDTAQALLDQAMALPIADCHHLEDLERLIRGLPAGGVKNALDWAAWQLRAEVADTPAWKLAHLSHISPLPTTVTIGAESPESMAATATALHWAPALKLKLDGGSQDLARVRAVREARADARLLVDANQGWDLQRLIDWSPMMSALGVELIEQPLPRHQDAELEGKDWPVPLAADESLQTIADLAYVSRRYTVANVKLDKCGGLSEALPLIHAARKSGLGVMVGCMLGTSLSLRPAYIAGQFADLVDLDAPLLLRADSEPSASYVKGLVHFPTEAFNGLDVRSS